METQQVASLLATSGAAALTVNDLTTDDLPVIGWAGNPAHLRSVARHVERAASGDCDYLAVRAPGGEPIAIGMIDYTLADGAGTLCQLAVHPDLQGMGLGTRLIAAAEQRICERELGWAVIGVEPDNSRAQALYERLGYLAYGRENESWEVEGEGGLIHLHQAEIILLKKVLVPNARD